MKYPHNYQSQRGATFVAMLALVGLLGLATGGAMLATGDIILDTARGGDESMHASHLGRQRDVHSGAAGEPSTLVDEVPPTPSGAVGGPWDDPTETVVSILPADSPATPVIINADSTVADILPVDGTKPFLLEPTFVTTSANDIQAYLDGLESITTIDYHAIVRSDLGNSSELFSILHPDSPSWDSHAALGSLAPPPLQQRDHEIMEIGGEVIHFVADRMSGLHCVSTPGSAGGFACIEEPEPNSSYNGESFLTLTLTHDRIARCKAYGTRDACSSDGELEERRKDEIREFIADGELIDGRFAEGPLEYFRGAINTIAKAVAPILLPEDIIASEVALAQEAGGWGQYGITSVLQTPDMLMAMVAGLWNAPGQMLEACVVGAYQCGAATGPTLIDLAIGSKGTLAVARTTTPRKPPRTQLFDGEGSMDPDRLAFVNASDSDVIGPGEMVPGVAVNATPDNPLNVTLRRTPDHVTQDWFIYGHHGEQGIGLRGISDHVDAMREAGLATNQPVFLNVCHGANCVLEVHQELLRRGHNTPRVLGHTNEVLPFGAPWQGRREGSAWIDSNDVVKPLPIAPVPPQLVMSPNALVQNLPYASDFGVAGPYTQSVRAAQYEAAMRAHLDSSTLRVVHGTFGGQAVIYNVDPITGLNVMNTPDGTFVSGWKLTTDQLEILLGSERL